MRRKKSFGISVGTSSILVIIVIVSLVCFAGLSIVSANVDYQLSRRLADRTLSYYEASSLANEQLANLNETLRQVYTECDNEEEFINKIKESYADSLILSYPVSETQTLTVEVEPVYPSDETARMFQITSFHVVTTTELELDDSLPVLFHN